MINQLGSVPSVDSVGMFGTVEVLNSFPDMLHLGLTIWWAKSESPRGSVCRRKVYLN
jgi:hypothetical protein